MDKPRWSAYKSGRKKTPLEKWLFIRNFGSNILKLNGLNSYDPGFRMRALSYVPGFAVLEVYVCLLYSIWWHKGDLHHVLMALSMFGSVIPVSSNAPVPTKSTLIQSASFTVEHAVLHVIQP